MYDLENTKVLIASDKMIDRNLVTLLIDKSRLIFYRRNLTDMLHWVKFRQKEILFTQSLWTAKYKTQCNYSRECTSTMSASNRVVFILQPIIQYALIRLLCLSIAVCDKDKTLLKAVCHVCDELLPMPVTVCNGFKSIFFGSDCGG